MTKLRRHRTKHDPTHDATQKRRLAHPLSETTIGIALTMKKAKTKTREKGVSGMMFREKKDLVVPGSVDSLVHISKGIQQATEIRGHAQVQAL